MKPSEHRQAKQQQYVIRYILYLRSRLYTQQYIITDEKMYKHHDSWHKGFTVEFYSSTIITITAVYTGICYNR